MSKIYDQERFEEKYVSRRLRELGLPEDFSEVVLAEGPLPSTEALDRITKKALERIHADTAPPLVKRTSPFFRRLKPVAVVLLIMAFIAGAWIGPARVWAGLQRVLQMVPGIGLIDREEFPRILVAAEPVREETAHGTLEVIGFSADEEKTLVHISFKNVPGYCDFWDPDNTDYLQQTNEYYEMAKQMYLLDGRGQKHHIVQFWGGTGGGNRRTEELQFSPIDLGTRLVTLVVPLPGEAEMQVKIPLEEISAHRLPNTITRHGITVSATARFGTGIWVFVGITPREPSATGHSHSFNLYGKRHWRGAPLGWEMLSLRGEDNRWYMGGSGSTEFRLDYVALSFDKVVHPAEKNITLNIPSLFLTEPGEATFTVPVPAKEGAGEKDLVYFRDPYSEARLTTYPDTAVSLDQVIHLGRFSFTLTRAELVSHTDRDYVRVYVDLGSPGEEVLVDFTISDEDGSLERYPRPPYWIQFSSSTGLLEYMELPLEGERDSITITLEEPVYMVKGPWTFTFPVR